MLDQWLLFPPTLHCLHGLVKGCPVLLAVVFLQLLEGLLQSQFIRPDEFGAVEVSVDGEIQLKVFVELEDQLGFSFTSTMGKGIGDGTLQGSCRDALDEFPVDNT